MFQYTPRTELEEKGALVLSASRLMAFDVSPKNYHSKYILEESETTEAMREGKIFHKAILEADRFKDEFVILEPKESFLVTIDDLKNHIQKFGASPVKGTKSKLIEQVLTIDPGARVWDNYLAQMEGSGKEIVNSKLWERCERVVDEVKNHPWLSRAFNGGEREAKLTWKYSDDVYMNMVFDFFHPTMGLNKTPVVIDVKTTQDASIHACRRAIERNKLLIQSAIYVDAGRDLLGIEPLFAWAFIETKPPYHVTMVAADFGMIEAGRKQYKGLIEKFKICHANNDWPAHDGGRVVSVGLSDWYLNKIEETFPDEDYT